MNIAITNFTVDDDRLADGDYFVRFVCQSAFVDSEGVERPLGSVQEFEAEASGGVLAASDVEVASTTDALVNQRSFYSVKICKANASRTVVRDLADGIVVPWALIPSYEWAELRLFTSAQYPFRDNEVFVKTETIREIDRRVAALVPVTPLAKGRATLVAGVATVPNTLVEAASDIHLTAQDDGVTGTPRVSSITPGVSFTIASSGGADEGVVSWVLYGA